MEGKFRITWHEELDSTNSEARRALDGLDKLSVIAAKCQTAGRGQGDHKWHSVPGENLTFSAVVKFGSEGGPAPLDVKDALLITQTVTLALRLYLQGHGVKARIKWPNDIYVGDRKVCGILIENVLAGTQVASSIIGIGLNINQRQFPADIPNPISLSLLTGRTYDVEKELEAFCDVLLECLDKTNTAEGRRYLDDIFNQYMFRLPGDSR